MTIEFTCPNCNEVIGFANEHAGKRARCTTCGQLFIIPAKSFEKAEKTKPPEEKSEPVPGFYHAVFIDNWKLFINPKNVTGLVFATAAVCFKFFTGHVDYSWTFGGFRFQAPVGLVITLASWGCLFWFYMEMICSTATDFEELPDVDMGGLFGFIWNIIKSLSVFAIVFVIVELPGIIFIIISGRENIISNILSLAGLFFFPIAILTISVVGDTTNLLRPGYIFKPVVKAFWPYLTTFVIFASAAQFQLLTVGYGRLIGKSNFYIALHLLANLAVQALLIISMRTIGLFYRHYSCHFKW